MTEHELQKKCNEYLRVRGIMFYHREKGRAHKRGGHDAGLPDLLIWYQGKHIQIEIKTLVGVMSKAQFVWRSCIEANGFRYYIVRTFEDFKKIIDNLGVKK